MTNEIKQGAVLRDEQDSLAPIQLEGGTGLSVDEEAALMRRGRRSRLLLAGLALVSVLGVSMVWAKQLDARVAYVSAASGMHHVRAARLEKFFRCALPDVDRSRVVSKDELYTAIEYYSDRMGKAYGAGLERCMPLLEPFAGELQAHSVPRDLSSAQELLVLCAESIELSVDNYRAYLAAPEHAYDFVQAAPLIEKITLAWEDYENAQASFERQARTRAL